MIIECLGTASYADSGNGGSFHAEHPKVEIKLRPMARGKPRVEIQYRRSISPIEVLCDSRSIRSNSRGVVAFAQNPMENARWSPRERSCTASDLCVTTRCILKLQCNLRRRQGPQLDLPQRLMPKICGHYL